MHASNKNPIPFLLATQTFPSLQPSAPTSTASGLWHALSKQHWGHPQEPRQPHPAACLLSTALGKRWGQAARAVLLINYLRALPAPSPSAKAKIIAAKASINPARQVVLKMRCTGCWLPVKRWFSSLFPDIKTKKCLFFFFIIFYSRSTLLCKQGIPQGSPTINMTWKELTPEIATSHL